MSERFFVEAPIEGDSAELVEAEAHHLLHVMRLKVGEQITLFDGSGKEFQARIAATTRRSVQLAILSSLAVNREREVPIILGVVLPKGDRQRWLVEKACELGAAKLVPLISARTSEAGKREPSTKLHRAIIEASKQCGRNKLMEISSPLPLVQFLNELEDNCVGQIAHPLSALAKNKQKKGPESCKPAIHRQPAAIHLAVGPEGGFTEEEMDWAVKAAWNVIDLGPRILRTETAALALIAAIGEEDGVLR